MRGDQVTEYLSKSDVILAVGSSLSPGRFSHAIPAAASKTSVALWVSFTLGAMILFQRYL